MFFLGLTFSLLLMGGGVILFIKGMTFYAILLSVVGFISLCILINRYQKRASRRNAQSGNATKDCGIIPDCDWIPDCIDLPDCDMPDCDVPDCGGDCSPDCSF